MGIILSDKIPADRMLFRLLEVVLWMVALVCLAITLNFQMVKAYLARMSGLDSPKPLWPHTFLKEYFSH